MVEREVYRIEKVIFESRPGLLVTGNLYVPKDRTVPLPGVIGLCGHSDNGKAQDVYQSFSQGLARLGYVVLIIDPIGQGERLQYPDAQLKSRIGVGVREHLLAGNQQFLVGEFFGAWRAWDGIRALDYLLTRPEVDPRRVGVTGNSGGGTMTTWLCGLDPRWTMAAPSCFVTTFRRNLENEEAADTEQCPPRALALGLDHEDFIAALAPKPVILLAKEQDYFDIRGTEEAFTRLKQLYRLLGAEENIAMFAGPTAHGYSKENREAMYRWFNRVTGVSNAQTEPELAIEKDETLWCAPNGQVCELKSRPVPAFTADRSQALAKQRRQLDRAGLLRAVSEALKLPPRSGTPDYRILRPASARRYPLPHATTYAVNTEPGIHALVYRLGQEPHYARPPARQGRAVLYVAHHSSDAELRDEPLIRQLLAEDPAAVFYACDVRGIGESRPDTCQPNSFLDPYGSDYFYAIHSLMLDRPYAGQKTHDVLRVLDWLKNCRHTEVHLAALGWGAVPATFAGADVRTGDSCHAEERSDFLRATLPSRRRMTGRSRHSCRACFGNSTCPIATASCKRSNCGKSNRGSRMGDCDRIKIPRRKPLTAEVGIFGVRARNWKETIWVIGKHNRRDGVHFWAHSNASRLDPDKSRLEDPRDRGYWMIS